MLFFQVLVCESCYYIQIWSVKCVVTLRFGLVCSVCCSCKFLYVECVVPPSYIPAIFGL